MSNQTLIMSAGIEQKDGFRVQNDIIITMDAARRFDLNVSCSSWAFGSEM
jgi:hypothetical protein